MRASILSLIFILTVSVSYIGKDALSADMKKIDIRPITVRIVDEGTNKPIENIQVYYAVDAYMQKKKRVWIFFPNLETRGRSRFLVKEREFSNRDGEVYFHATNQSLDENEIVEHEFIYINIDIDMNHPDVKLISSIKGATLSNLDILKDELLTYNPGKKFFLNSNPSYKGFYVMSTYRNQGPDDCGSPQWDIFDYNCIGEGLKKNREEITVKLPKF